MLVASVDCILWTRVDSFGVKWELGAVCRRVGPLGNAFLWIAQMLHVVETWFLKKQLPHVTANLGSAVFM